jgi:hypothetical protein
VWRSSRTRAGNDYWDHVDWVVAAANQRGLYVGFLPTWGDKWNQKWGAGPQIFTPANAEAYGLLLGQRYRDAGLVWILGGDRPIESEAHADIIRAMARGLRQGDGGAHLQTFHPTGGDGSAHCFPDGDWLDFNMRQNGHAAGFTGRYDQTRVDYDRVPTKPVLDGEPIYEGHPIAFKQSQFGHSLAADVRRPLHWNLFAGACGHTYGSGQERGRGRHGRRGRVISAGAGIVPLRAGGGMCGGGWREGSVAAVELRLWRWPRRGGGVNRLLAVKFHSGGGERRSRAHSSVHAMAGEGLGIPAARPRWDSL